MSLSRDLESLGCGPPPPSARQPLFTRGARRSILPSGGCDLIFGGRAVGAPLQGSGPPWWPANCGVPETLSSDLGEQNCFHRKTETSFPFVTVLACALMAHKWR